MKRLLGWLLAGPGALLWIAKTALFLVGASTAPEDFALLPGKFADVAAFIQRQPALAFYLVTSAMVVVGLAIVFRRPNADEAPTNAAAPPATPGVTITSHNQSGGITAHTVNREDRNV